ncbi:MAG TPA: methyl-accepting chemotaxis protein [Spirochaetota bacterium]|nr:methyl-accepting chemotaxis protein [Spirochaetota bacterium]
MKHSDYTARQVLEIKSSFMFFILVIVLAFFGNGFQMLAKVTLAGLLPSIMLNVSIIVMAFFVYMRKRALRSAAVFEWILGFVATTGIIFAKYNYAKSYDWSTVGWTYAAQSYNTSIYLAIFLVLLQLLYNRKLFIFYAIWGLAHWALFFALAVMNGALVHPEAIGPDGIPFLDGVIMLREIFFIIAVGFISFVCYRNIPITQEYDERTTRQRELIEKQAAEQRALVVDIKEKMNILFGQVDEQNQLVGDFNEKMQSQSATFEEMSATLEELLASAENIHVSSVDQIDGNVKMETIVSEFRSIKQETKGNLAATFQDIEAVVNRTTQANERLQDVEKTIGKIKAQATRIAETVTLIVDIADRVNLLSLNASIEAARAGEYGRGFAVVADEIGKLAYQTAESIKEIERVLSLSAQTTEEGVGVINSTAEMIKGMIMNMGASSNKIKVLQESIFIEEKYINIIIDQMTKNIQLAKNIGMGTDEQKSAIESSARAVEHVNEIVMAMAKEISELALTSQNILDNARDLMARAETIT